MVWWGWLIVGAYIIGAVQTWRVAAWVVASDDSHGEAIGGDSLIFGLVIGAFVGAVWIVVVPLCVAYKSGALVGGGRAFVCPPPSERRKERERRLRDREARIERMERELKIGPYREKQVT